MKLKEKELDLLIGLIIGDGSIYKSQNSYCFEMGHGKSQKDYCEWKMNILNESKIFKTKVHMKTRLINNKYIRYNVRKTSIQLKELYDLFVINNKKTIYNILKLLKSNRSVAMWFMDDCCVEPSRRKLKNGTIRYYRPNLKLCTHCFSYEEHLIIKKWFKSKYLVDCEIRKEIKKNREGHPEYYFLRFDADNTEKIYNKVLKEYIHCCPSMEYKFRYIINIFEKSN